MLWLLGVPLAAGCTPPEQSLPLERATPEGQRLWYLAVPVPGMDASRLDPLVVQPLINAFGRDERAEVIGGLSRSGAGVVFFRASVACSSMRIARRALEKVDLPDGTRMPLVGAAGQPGQAALSLQTPMPQWLLEGGLGAADLLATLATTPDWLAQPAPPRPPPFDFAVRLRAHSPAALETRWLRCRREAGARPSDRWPPAGRLLRLDARQVMLYLTLSGPDAAERCRRLAASGENRTCRRRTDMPDAERALLAWPDQ